MKNKIKELIKKIIRWALDSEIRELEYEIKKSKDYHNDAIQFHNKLYHLVRNIDVSVDIHQYAPSWAVISIQGEKADFIKFINLSKNDAKEIELFLRNFDRDRRKVDAPLNFAKYLKF